MTASLRDAPAAVKVLAPSAVCFRLFPWHGRRRPGRSPASRRWRSRRGARCTTVWSRAAAPSRATRPRPAAGVSRALAAFHLDRLVAAGLLVASYRRLTGRTGPGAGRPAKLYSRAPEQLDVSLPPRRYGLAAELFAQALDDAGDQGGVRAPARPAGQGIRQAARRHGRRRTCRGEGGDRRARAARLRAGPHGRTGEVRLRNCPFHALTERHKSLVCGANLALLEGFVAELQGGRETLRAALDPQPGMCCVVLRPTGKSAARRSRRGHAH